MTAPLVVVGDALLDVDLEGASTRDCPDAPGAPVVDVDAERARPGGAALAAQLAARLGDRPVVLLTALGADPAGRRLAGLLDDRIALHPLALDGTTPVKTRLLDGGRPVARIDTGDGSAARTAVDEDTARLLATAGAVLVADYGRGVAAHPGLRDLLLDRPAGIPLVWDPHPRGPDPVPGADLVTPNAGEARAVTGATRPGRAARLLRERWRARAVAVTRGAAGAVLDTGRTHRVPVPAGARPAAGSRPDSCGAGDVFAAAATLALGAGGTARDAVASAVAEAGRFVAAGGAAGAVAAVSDPAPVALARLDGAPDGFALAERVRRDGGRVAATGGCFDLLHPGHVAVLRAARARGDVLVVCLNSDDSVARLKGPGRPYATAADRAAVLNALTCVDAVVVFDEPDPTAVLDRLRPDVWVKGGDHDPGRMPEARVVRAHGGTVETVPRVGGHSTTRLAAAAVTGAAARTTDSGGHA